MKIAEEKFLKCGSSEIGNSWRLNQIYNYYKLYFDFTEESMEETQSKEGKDKDGSCVKLKNTNRKRKGLSVQYKKEHKKNLPLTPLTKKT